MKKIIILLVLFQLFTSYGMAKFLGTAIPGTLETEEQKQIVKIVETFNISEKYAKAIVYGSKIYERDPMLVAFLFYTESRFNKNAVSEKGYVGIAQVPKGSSIRPVVNIVHGIDILDEKLAHAKGNILKSLALYKGGENNEAYKQARQVLALKRNFEIKILNQ